jgi:glycosyltransferase involved in cell wall biosynthesis
MRHPAHLNVLLRACPASFKIVYSKHWEPWAVERLDSFDLCLLDEQHQVHQVQKRYPAVHCGVWDKLVDYERTHRPVECQKAYDLCYVAYLRRRKNHELLFSALSKLRARGLSCVCVGEDRKGYRSHLEQRATQLGLQVDFTGEVSPVQVNDYVNRSRIGVICSRRDAVPRAILEYLAADVPVLVNSELVAGTRYVGATAGLTRSPEQFHVGIEQLLGNLQQYTPRRHYLANFSTDQVVRRFVRILTSAGLSIASGSRAQLGVV